MTIYVHVYIIMRHYMIVGLNYAYVLNGVGRGSVSASANSIISARRSLIVLPTDGMKIPMYIHSTNISFQRLKERVCLWLQDRWLPGVLFRFKMMNFVFQMMSVAYYKTQAATSGTYGAYNTMCCGWVAVYCICRPDSVTNVSADPTQSLMYLPTRLRAMIFCNHRRSRNDRSELFVF